MNAEETTFALQATINYLLVALASSVKAESVTKGNKQIDLGLGGDVTILSNGTVIYRPAGQQQSFSIDQYTAIFNPPYPPVQPTPTNTCPVCKGSGTI